MKRFSEEGRVRVATRIYWLLLIYIIAALVWWCISLLQQNNRQADLELANLGAKNNTVQDAVRYSQQYNGIIKHRERARIKYISEGAIFLIITLIGAVFVFRAVRKQLRLGSQQQNFIMAVTHELKTPIAVSKLNIETLRKRKLSDAQQQRLLGNTLEELQRLTDLANNILVVSQIDTGGYKMNREAIHLSELLQTTVNEFASQFAGRTIEARIATDIFTEGDSLMLKLVVHNLIDNALKYSPAAEPIMVELTKDPRPIIRVYDRGNGVGKEEKEKVFEKFYRAGSENTRIAKGTGLGLYLCRKILADHKADIIVTDNSPQGSIFVITFNN
jgi:two-component system, OmpR family, sensor histidine kinase CiaH